MSDKIYSKDEVERILKRAIQRNTAYSDGISEEDLFRIASELNISREQVLESLKDDDKYREYEQARSIWLEKKKHSFREHLITYSIVNAIIIGTQIATEGRVSWALFPLAGWGIGLAIDYYNTYHPSEYTIDKEARKLMKSAKWKQVFDSFGTKILEVIQKK